MPGALRSRPQSSERGQSGEAGESEAAIADDPVITAPGAESPAATARVLRGTLVIVLALRLLVAFFLPFTGDEAYYYYWGAYPALAYYDHPPMVGWLMAPVVAIGMAEWWLRMPALLLVFAVAWMVRRMARIAGPVQADLAALCVLLVPAELFNVLTTTDTPLVLFSMASLLAYQTAVQSVEAGGAAVNRWHAVAGLLLGAAFMSKYFAVLLGLAYLVFALSAARRARAWPGFFIVTAAALPWALANAWGNYEHCWLNVLFNFENRHDNVRLSPSLVATYLVCIIYLTSPFALWRLARRASEAVRSRVASGPRPPASPTLRDDAARWLPACAFLVPVIVLGLVSTVRSVGLHWPLAFTPLAFVLAAFCLPERALRTDVRYLAVLSGVHALVFAVLALMPLETWRGYRIYDGLVLTVKSDELLAALAPWRGSHVFATDGYSNSVTLGYQARRAAMRAGGHAEPVAGTAPDARPVAPAPLDLRSLDFLVFGTGSAHGRQQDVFDDFRVLDGRDILVLRKTPPPPAEYEPYFDSVEYSSVDVRGVTFHIIRGRHFRFERYRDGVLRLIRDRFYRAPGWLPEGRCFFCERYFGADARAATMRAH